MSTAIVIVASNIEIFVENYYRQILDCYVYKWKGKFFVRNKKTLLIY